MTSVFAHISAFLAGFEPPAWVAWLMTASMMVVTFLKRAVLIVRSTYNAARRVVRGHRPALEAIRLIWAVVGPPVAWAWKHMVGAVEVREKLPKCGDLVIETGDRAKVCFRYFWPGRLERLAAGPAVAVEAAPVLRLVPMTETDPDDTPTRPGGAAMPVPQPRPLKDAVVLRSPPVLTVIRGGKALAVFLHGLTLALTRTRIARHSHGSADAGFETLGREVWTARSHPEQVFDTVLDRSIDARSRMGTADRAHAGVTEMLKVWDADRLKAVWSHARVWKRDDMGSIRSRFLVHHVVCAWLRRVRADAPWFAGKTGARVAATLTRIVDRMVARKRRHDLRRVGQGTWVTGVRRQGSQDVAWHPLVVILSKLAGEFVTAAWAARMPGRSVVLRPEAFGLPA